jgi:hypothetical protein
MMIHPFTRSSTIAILVAIRHRKLLQLPLLLLSSYTAGGSGTCPRLLYAEAEAEAATEAIPKQKKSLR